MSEAPPYIGVTGFMSPDEVQIVQDMIDPAAGRKLMVGVLVSGKTMRGMPNKYPYKYPPIGQVAGILEAVDPGLAFGLIHLSSDEQNLWSECHRTVKASGLLRSNVKGNQLRGFQYNYIWPDPGLVNDANTSFRREFYGYKPWHVLQLGPVVLESSLVSIREGVRRYKVSTSEPLPLSYLLIDMSGGRGQEPQWSEILTVLEALLELTGTPCHLNLAVAGGLSADTVSKLRPLVEMYPDLSIDAEGQLRAEDGSLSIDKTKAYIEAAYELFA